MKSALVLLALLSFTACTTSSNHRDLWSPAKAHGTYTMKSRGTTLAGRYDHRSATSHYVITKEIGGAATMPSAQPIMPPASAQPVPGANVPDSLVPATMPPANPPESVPAM